MESQIIHYFVTISGALLSSIIICMTFIFIHYILFWLPKLIMELGWDTMWYFIVPVCVIIVIILEFIYWKPGDKWTQLIFEIPIAVLVFSVILAFSSLFLARIYKYKDFDDFIKVTLIVVLIIFSLMLPSIFIFVIFSPNYLPIISKFVNNAGLYCMTIEFVLLLILVPVLLYKNIRKLFD